MTKDDDGEFQKRILEIRKIIDAIPVPEDESLKSSIAERIPRMLEHVMGRIDYYENSRLQYLNISLTLFIASAGVIAVIFQFLPTFVILSIPFMLLMAFTMIETFVFIRDQSPKYPYGSCMKDPFYYEYFLSSASCEDFRTLFPWKKHDKENRVLLSAMNDLVSFLKEKWLGNTEEGLLKEDLEYVFLMSLIFGNKRRHVKIMARILGIGIGVFVLALFASVMYSVFPLLLN